MQIGECRERNVSRSGELEVEGGLPAFTAARLTALCRIGITSDPFPLVLERVPETGETTAVERLALVTGVEDVASFARSGLRGEAGEL
jgi:hypothetical protein